MLTRALSAAQQSRAEPEIPPQDTQLSAPNRARRRHLHKRKRDQVYETSTKIGKYISHAVPITMRNKHFAEFALTLNREHFSGLSEVLPQLENLNKYKTPHFDPDTLDGALLNAPANLEVDNEDLGALVKEDGKLLAPLQYFKSEAERAPYVVSIGADNTLVWTATQQPVGKGTYIFVWGPNEKLYAAAEGAPGRQRDFRHSTFFAGAAVLFAGEFETDEQGRMVKLNNKSGHYRPEFAPWVTFLSFLRTQGVDAKRVEKMFVTKSKRQAFYLKWLQLNGSDTGQVNQIVKQRK
jgi:hypothetical protein